MIPGRGLGSNMLRRCCVVSEEIWLVIVWKEMGMEWSMVFVCEACPNEFNLSFLRIFPGGYDTGIIATLYSLGLLWQCLFNTEPYTSIL
jgi:hypothetical protein